MQASHDPGAGRWWVVTRPFANFLRLVEMECWARWVAQPEDEDDDFFLNDARRTAAARELQAGRLIVAGWR